MNHREPPPGTAVRIGHAGTGFALLYVATVLVAIAGMFAFMGSDAGRFWYPMSFALLSVVTALVVVVGRRGHVLVIDDDGLLVKTPKRSVRYLWADLLEVGWAPARRFTQGPGLVVRPKGGPWASPGPNSPARVGTFAVFGPRAQREAADAVRQACVRHGVPFADDAERMLSSAPPGSAWRDLE